MPPERPVFHPLIGAELRKAREARRWSLRQAARIARERGLSHVSTGAMQLLEAGKIKSPGRELLQEIAVLLDLGYEELADRFGRSLYSYTVEGRASGPMITAVSANSVGALVEDLARIATTKDEVWLLKAWRQMDAAARKAVRPVIKLALTGAHGKQHPPTARGTRKKAV